MPLRNALWFISYVHTYTHIYVYMIYIYSSKELYAFNCKHMSNLLKYFERTYVLRRKKIFLTNEHKVRVTMVRTIQFEDNRNSFQALIINLLGKYFAVHYHINIVSLYLTISIYTSNLTQLSLDILTILFNHLSFTTNLILFLLSWEMCCLERKLNRIFGNP